MKEIKISIITVVLNDKEGFLRTAESITAQTAFKETEWIVIDGKSTDGTTDVIEQFNDYISYSVSEPDKGIYDAMNKGIKQASGKYLLFMNAGDCISDTKVIENVINLEYFGNVDYIIGNTRYCRKGKLKSHIYSPTKITCRFLFKYGICHQSAFIKRERLANGYNTDYKIFSDSEHFFKELIINNRSYKVVNMFISDFDCDGISLTNVQLSRSERKKALTNLLSQQIYDECYRRAYGTTKLEKIICNIKENGFLYKIITIVAIIVYTPKTIAKQIIAFLRKAKNQ